jgi:penicillin-binding protein 2
VRIGGLAVLVGVAVCVLVLRAWSIQILHGPQYKSLANGQAYRTIDFAGSRGIIVDAKGRTLADTTQRVVVAADVAALGSVDNTGWHASNDGLASLRRFSKVAHVPVKTLVTRIERSVVRSPFAPAVVLPEPTSGLIGYLEERSDEFPGFKTSTVVSRSYPQGAFGGEFLGLLGEVSDDMLSSPHYAHAKPGEVVGTSGVEAEYDKLLNGGFKRARLRVDSQGRVVGPLEYGPQGKALPKLQLTIDAKLQRAAERAIANGVALARANGHSDANAAAAVVMNPRTGGIYALASYPSFNQVAAATKPAYKASLLTGKIPGYYNQATQGVFPTGSTFKPIVAEAAMQEGLLTPYTPKLCSGSYTVGGIVFRNVEAGVYSSMTLPTALAESCDTWFYRVGADFYVSRPNGMQTWAKRLGLGHSTGVDVPGESPGLVPTTSWLKKTDGALYEGQTINLSIGQGYLQATPLQMAVAYSALANGGTVVRPHVASAVVDGQSVKPLTFKPVRRLKLKDLWAIREGLYMAAHSPAGTSASLFADFPIPVAGKTGTAEAGTGRSDHSWYASWAPANNPKVVVVVVVAHGGFGAQAAAPAARDIYKAYFNVK